MPPEWPVSVQAGQYEVPVPVQPRHAALCKLTWSHRILISEFHGDGIRCVVDEDVGCDIVRDYHTNATYVVPLAMCTLATFTRHRTMVTPRKLCPHHWRTSQAGPIAWISRNIYWTDSVKNRRSVQSRWFAAQSAHHRSLAVQIRETFPILNKVRNNYIVKK